MKLLATGESEAAEQQKLAIMRAVIQVAQGKTEATWIVNEAAEKYFFFLELDGVSSCLEIY